MAIRRSSGWAIKSQKRKNQKLCLHARQIPMGARWVLIDLQHCMSAIIIVWRTAFGCIGFSEFTRAYIIGFSDDSQGTKMALLLDCAVLNTSDGLGIHLYQICFNCVASNVLPGLLYGIMENNLLYREKSASKYKQVSDTRILYILLDLQYLK